MRDVLSRLQEVCKMGKSEIVEELLAQLPGFAGMSYLEARKVKDALAAAARKGSHKCLAAFVDRGDLNDLFVGEAPDVDILNGAVKRNSLKCVNILLDAGWKPTRETAFHALSKSVGVVSTIIEATDREELEKKGETPIPNIFGNILHAALLSGCVSAIPMLLNKGLNAMEPGERRSRFGAVDMFPVDMAAMKTDSLSLKYLIKGGARPVAGNPFGEALVPFNHTTSKIKETLKVIEVLVDNGFKVKEEYDPLLDLMKFGEWREGWNDSCLKMANALLAAGARLDGTSLMDLGKTLDNKPEILEFAKEKDLRLTRNEIDALLFETRLGRIGMRNLMMLGKMDEKEDSLFLTIANLTEDLSSAMIEAWRNCSEWVTDEIMMNAFSRLKNEDSTYWMEDFKNSGGFNLVRRRGYIPLLSALRAHGENSVLKLIQLGEDPLERSDRDEIPLNLMKESVHPKVVLKAEEISASLERDVLDKETKASGMARLRKKI